MLHARFGQRINQPVGGSPAVRGVNGQGGDARDPQERAIRLVASVACFGEMCFEGHLVTDHRPHLMASHVPVARQAGCGLTSGTGWPGPTIVGMPWSSSLGGMSLNNASNPSESTVS